MAAPKLNRERAARILVEAEAIGNDRKASEKLGITDRTIRNYRTALESDPELSALFRKYAAAESRSWHLARTRALRIANQRAVQLLENEEDLDKVTRFIEKTGGVDIAGEALGVSSRPGREGPPAPEDAGDTGEGSAEAEDRPGTH